MHNWSLRRALVLGAQLLTLAAVALVGVVAGSAATIYAAKSIKVPAERIVVSVNASYDLCDALRHEIAKVTYVEESEFRRGHCLLGAVGQFDGQKVLLEQRTAVALPARTFVDDLYSRLSFDDRRALAALRQSIVNVLDI